MSPRRLQDPALLLRAGSALLVAGLVIVVLSDQARLIAVGSILGGVGTAMLIAAISFEVSNRQRREALHDRERDASQELAMRLSATKDHRGQYFAHTVLRQAVDLSERDFSEAALEHIDWSQVTLTEAVFRDSSLAGARLSNCFGKQGDFRHATLDGARLEGLLERTDFRASSCAATDFRAAFLDWSGFESLPDGRTHLRGANFAGSSGLDGVRFNRSLCQEADFSRSKLYDCEFEQAFLAEAKFDEAAIGAHFHGAMFAAITGVEAASFAHSSLLDLPRKRVDLSETWLVGVDLSTVSGLEYANLAGAIALDANQFPPDFDLASSGVQLLGTMSGAEADSAVSEWIERHGRPAGWI